MTDLSNQETSIDSVAHRLASLFEQHLNITDEEQRAESPSTWTNDGANPSIKYSITQHYTHSAHINSQSLHPLQPHRDDRALRLLIQNDIAPSSLLRSQLDLFERSNTDDQAKLIMLWRLAPPSYARNGGQELADRLGEYQSITLAQEEELAWLRYQRHFARRDERADTQAEQLCGRHSLLGPYYEHAQQPDERVSVRAEYLEHAQHVQHADGDQEMT